MKRLYDDMTKYVIRAQKMSIDELNDWQDRIMGTFEIKQPVGCGIPQCRIDSLNAEKEIIIAELTRR